MKTVIDIDDNLYTRLFDNGDECIEDMRKVCVAIRNGIPLLKGQWIFLRHNGFGRRIFKCSNCNFNGDTYGYKYCPNCGLRMVSE